MLLTIDFIENCFEPRRKKRKPSLDDETYFEQSHTKQVHDEQPSTSNSKMPLTGLENRVIPNMGQFDPVKLQLNAAGVQVDGQTQLLSYLSQIQQSKALSAAMPQGLHALQEQFHQSINAIPQTGAGILGSMPSVMKPSQPAIHNAAYVGVPLTTPTSAPPINTMMQQQQMASLHGVAIQNQYNPGASLQGASMYGGLGKDPLYSLPSNAGLAMMLQQSPGMIMPGAYQQPMIKGYTVPSMQ